ncbi:MAG: hypothetical protein JWN50_659 [Parcubacteria group bacterium]|nr:hypothetical protein [Parcubacteria group bacterium]
MKYLWAIFIATGVGFFISGSYGAVIGLTGSVVLVLIGAFIDGGRSAGLSFGEALGYTLLLALIVGAGAYGYTQDGLLGALGGVVGAFVLLTIVRPANFKTASKSTAPTKLKD